MNRERQFFSLGRLNVRPSICGPTESDIEAALLRHSRGQWGEVRGDNDDAIRKGGPITSIHRTKARQHIFFLVTDQKKEVTHVLTAAEAVFGIFWNS